MRGSLLSPAERVLRYACILLLLLGAVAVVADWAVAAVVLLGLGGSLTVLSLVLEWLTARHRNRQLAKFYPEADNFLDELFRDQQP